MEWLRLNHPLETGQRYAVWMVWPWALEQINMHMPLFVRCPSGTSHFRARKPAPQCYRRQKLAIRGVLASSALARYYRYERRYTA